MPLAPGTKLGHYEIVSTLGAGGMGEVYRARDGRLERDIAIKLLGSEYSQDPTRLARFEQEARAVSALNHPHIVSVFDVGRAEHGAYLVMEMVDGRTLRDLLEEGTLPLKRVLAIAAQVADGLARAHGAGLVHRDMKPENIMVTRDGFAKILDFGLVKLVPAGLGTSSATSMTVTSAVPATTPGMVLGTVGYMSPEQARGRELDFRSDQFSFGTILYEMLTGKRPFQRESSAQTLAAIIEDDAPPLAEASPKTPTAVRWIVERCIAKDAEDRYASTRDLARDLEVVRHHLSEATSSVSQTGISPPRTRSQQRWQLPLLGAIALAVGFGLGALAFRKPQQGAPAIRYLTFSGADAQPTISPDGGTIAFTSRRDGHQRIWLKQMQGGGEVPLTEGEDVFPRFSPDGSMLVYTHREPSGPSSIFRTALLGAEPRKIAEKGHEPEWSPDGKHVVFLRTSGAGDLSTDIVEVDADGGNPHALRTVEGLLGGMRWSPDGKYLLGTMRARGLTSEAQKFMILSADGKEQRTATPVIGGDIAAAAWTGNADEIVYARSESVGTASGINSNTISVVLQNIATGKTQRLMSLPGGSTGVEITAKGNLVLDLATSRQNLRVGAMGNTAASAKPKWLTRGSASDRQPVVSADGETVAFSSNRSGNLDIWTLSVKTGAVKRITDDAADDWDPGFSPDGKQLVWSSHRSGNFEVWIANADGSGARQVSHDGVDAENPALTRQGWVIYNSGNPQHRGLWKVRSDGTEASALTKQQCDWPDASPDGQYVVCTVNGRENIVVRVSDGQTVFRVPLRGLGRSRWLPNGKAIAVIEPAGLAGSEIVTHDFTPNQQVPGPRHVIFSSEDELVETFSFHPDGKQVVYSSLEQQSAIVRVEGIEGIAPPQRSPR